MSKHCDVCDIQLIDEYSYHGHLMGKKHLKNLELSNIKKKQEENSIFVRPIPPQTTQEMLTKFFSQFGPTKYCKFGQTYVIVEYKTNEPVEFLLNTPIYYNRWKLKIKRRIVDFPQQRKRTSQKSTSEQSTSGDITDDELSERIKFKTELELKSSWDGQLEKFLNYVQDDDNLVHERGTKVCHSLNSVLEQSFPHGRAIRFGSTVTGLHTKQSDIDIFFDIGELIDDDDSSEDEYRRNQNKKWTLKSIFKRVKIILFKYSSTFSNVVPIPMAKIPVIKFHHISTNTDCDITFKHGLGAQNSQLIKHFLSMDKRLKPLMIIIKYWAKMLDISGTGKITNYSLAMAAIFYLQQPNVNLLPTVVELQSSCEPILSCGWSVNFNRNISRDTSSNESTIPELLHGFFKFYAEFNFSNNVICPYDGLIVSKIDFGKNMTDLGIQTELLKLNKPVCIQDPFQFDHNIAEGWQKRTVQLFQQYCNEGVDLCEYSVKDDYLSLLPAICDPALKIKSKSPSLMQMAILAGKFETFGLPNDFDTRTDIENKEKYIENNWFKIVDKLVRKIFINIFKFELQTIYDEINLKQIKIEENTDVHTKANDKILFICRGKYCLSRSRKNRIPLLDPTISCIEKETMISDKIIAELKEKNDETMIKFICSLEKKTNPLHVMITLTDEQHTKKTFMEIGNYMRSKIPSIIDKELLHMTQYKKQL